MNKGGEIGETMTWTIATIIIVLILVVSIAIASSFGTLNFLKKAYKLDYKMDLVPVKSFSAYLLSRDQEGSGQTVFQKFQGEDAFEQLDGENGKLASKIFNQFYEEDYVFVWFGLYFNGTLGLSDYFGSGIDVADFALEVRPCGGTTIFLGNKGKEATLDLCR